MGEIRTQSAQNQTIDTQIAPTPSAHATDPRRTRAKKATILAAAAALTLTGCSEMVDGNAVAANTSASATPTAPSTAPGKIALKANALTPVSPKLCGPDIKVSDPTTVMRDLSIDATTEKDNWVCVTDLPYNSRNRTYLAYGELVLSGQNPVGSVEFLAIDDKLTDGSGTLFDEVGHMPGAKKLSETEYYVASTLEYPSPSLVKRLQGEGDAAVDYITQVNPRVKDDGSFVAGFPTNDEMQLELSALADHTVDDAFPYYTGPN
jgi:hypothetical protein